MSDSNIYLDGTGNFNALTKNAGTIKYGTFNNAASNTGVVAVSAIFTGTAVNSGVIGNILPINTANLVASNSAAWESTYLTVADLSAEWSAGGGSGGGAADLTAISDVSASWDAAATFVSLNSSILVDTYDARLSDERTPAAHTQAISTIDGLQTALNAKQASGSYAAASHSHTSSDVTGFASDVAALIVTAAGDTVASLVNGKVPSVQLPSYVDDVVEAADVASLSATGETGKIYVTTGTNKTYRWSGSAYVEISPSPGSTDSVTEGSSNLYFTNVRAAAAAPVQSVAGKTGAVTLSTSDVSGLAALISSNGGDKYLTSSTSSITINNANGKSITVATGLAYTSQQDITVAYDAAHHMHGTVVSYNSATGVLVFDVNSHTGSGTYAQWTINVGGITSGVTSVAGRTGAVTLSTSDVAGLSATIDALQASIDASAAAAGDFAAADDARLVLVGTNSASWDGVYSTVQGSSAIWGAGGGGGGSAEGIYAYTTVNTYSATWNTQNNHTHAISAVTNLQANINSLSSAIDGKQASGSYASATDARIVLVGTTSANWNNSYTTLNANSAIWTAVNTAVASSSARWTSSYNTLTATSATWSAKANASHTHAIADVTNLQTSLDAKASTSHTHTIANVTNLQTSLDAKASTSHTHAIADVTNLQTSLDAKASSTDARIVLVGTTSANWNNSYTAIAPNSANWQSAYTGLSGKASTSHTHTASQVTDFNTAADARITAAAGVSIASLVGGTIPSAQLPSYVDDVLEYAATGNFPATGSAGIIYVATGTNKTYRWSGSAYVEISPSPGSTDSVTEGSVNLYFTNARATAALQTSLDAKASATDARITLVGTSSANWNSAYTGLSGKANTSHTHAIADVTGLQTALDGKASSTSGPYFAMTYTTSTGGTAFTVTASTSPTASSANYIVSLDGIMQVPTTDYSVSGTTMTFTSTVPSGVKVLVLTLMK
jgi:hypothetical protein